MFFRQHQIEVILILNLLQNKELQMLEYMEGLILKKLFTNFMILKSNNKISNLILLEFQKLSSI